MTDKPIDRGDVAADAVLDELNGRKGFDWWWDDLEKAIQDEIREAIARRIRAVGRDEGLVGDD